MADVAQLVRASVCGTECRRFESGHPPHKIQPHQNGGVKFYQGGPDENRRFDKIAGANEQGEVQAVAIWKGAHERSEVGIYNPVIRPINKKIPHQGVFFYLLCEYWFEPAMLAGSKYCFKANGVRRSAKGR